jgi:hypothetical protein
MDKQIEEFLSLGMQRYKQASATMVSFGQEVEARLQRILSERTPDRWGNFLPDHVKQAKSTRYWSQYPVLNAKIDGTINGAAVRITIEINWYQSESEYPFYSAWLDPADPYLQAMSEFDWSNGVYFEENGIRLAPDEEDFALERDFNILLNEFVNFLEI